MSRTPRKPTTPTKPLVRLPTRIGALDTAAVIAQLRQFHEEAEDADVDRMPADQELFGALLYLETHVRALKDVSVRRTSAIERVKMWEYLREQVDVHQARAVEDARAARAEWAELAPALAVKVPSAAYNKALRLRAAAVHNPAQPDRPVRRTPEAVLLAERQAARKAAAERRAEEEAARRHALITPVARRLLELRADLDDEDDVTFWLDQIEAVLPHCETPTQFVSLDIYVKAVVRGLQKGGLAQASEDVKAAYEAAVAIVST